MANDNTLLALTLGAGAGLGLWYLLGRDDQARGGDEAAAPPSQPAPAAPPQPAPAAPPPCSLRLDAKGLTADGAAVDVPTAIATCKAAGKADLVLADDAPSAAYADLAAAFGAAGVLINQRRNAGPRRRRKRTSRQAAAPVDLADFAATVRALAAEIDEDPTPDGLARGRFARKVFIAAIRRALRRTKYASLPRQTVDRLLVDANREGLLELARADLVAVMDPAEVRDSEIQHLMSTWHFVVAPRDDGRRGAGPARYLAWCGTCYSGARLETDSRRKASIHATSHLNLYPGHDVHVTDRAKERTRDERNVRGQRDRSDRELTALVALVEQLGAASAARQGAAPPDPAVKLARFIATHSGARVDEASLDHQDNVVVTGTPANMRKVAAWVARLARDSGRDLAATVETFEDDPEDSDWAICRIRGLVQS